MVEGVLVGVAADDQHWAASESELKETPKMLGTFAGSDTRADTVLNGISALTSYASSEDWVLVHDAARPCVRQADIHKLISEVQGHEDGGLLALPVSDTVKRTDDTRAILETVSRANLWRAVTPQLFPLERLSCALEQALSAGVVITDEAAAVEYVGGRPRVVAGHADNIKITVVEDLALAELFLKKQQEQA
jgi:2-C-methyl-D-erythritol 4-phosphate cytidylyltransferase